MRAMMRVLLTFVSLMGLIRTDDDRPPPTDTQPRPVVQEAVRFRAVDVYVDSALRSLAAYQFELKAKGAEVKMVGVEGGGHAAFAEPPYYDPKALMGGRIIIAAFNTGKDLPTGKTRVATVHVQVTGDKAPEYSAKLTVAASTDGERIPAAITLGQRKGDIR